jgi:predicted ArsR family transcriptional regulator
MQNHYLAHLLQKSEGRDITSPREEEVAPERRESQEQSVREQGGEVWKEAELLEREGLAEEGTLESATLSEEEEEAAHGEARRLARLLVAEIKLYNEKEVGEGRQNADLYRRLRTDIDRSRKMYEKLVHPWVKSLTDYYGAEVIRVLAQDDPDLMGSDYEGSGVSNPIDQESD